jgi:4-amino-4-deoxy-L-arabinose transferase-like glycosyltransferase
MVAVAAMLGTALVARWYACRLYGDAGGMVALCLTAFCPNLLAFGGIATTDMVVTFFVALSMVATRLLLERPTLARAAAVGACVGLACITKFSGLLLVAVVPALAWRQVRLLPVAAFAWLATVAVGYAGDRMFEPIGSFPLESESLKTIAAWIPAATPVPLPYWFVKGFDLQLADTGYEAYALGQFNTEGFWFYYFLCLATKLAEPVIVLAVAAGMIGRWPIMRAEIPVVLLIVAGMTAASLAGHKNVGIRYVLFLVPFLAIWAARIVQARSWRLPAVRAVVYAGCLWMAGTACAYWPHYIPYFNSFCGGPTLGHRYLLDSNLDWGQDLIGLRQYMETEQIPEVGLAYFGRIRPELYGIKYRPIREMTAPGCIAISANLLWGRAYFVNAAGPWTTRDAFASLRSMQPTHVIGHSIYIFDMRGGLRP